MPLKRDPKRLLTESEKNEIAALDAEIAKLADKLGGKLCWCGRAAFDDEWCWECKPIA